MIDAREELAPASSNRQARRNAPLTAEKSGRIRASSGKVSTVKSAATSRKSLKVDRVFSDLLGKDASQRQKFVMERATEVSLEDMDA